MGNTMRRPGSISDCDVLPEGNGPPSLESRRLQENRYILTYCVPHLDAEQDENGCPLCNWRSVFCGMQ